ncbi:MAG: N,N-dimethylformamidase beta subunit family domain-containing protein [Paracoccaceae bacterium]
MSGDPPGPEFLRRAVHSNYAERPPVSPGDFPWVRAYVTPFSAGPGGHLSLHASTTAAEISVRIRRDGAVPREVFAASGIAAGWQASPENLWETGCGWPVTLRIPVGEDWPSGAYVVRTECETKSGRDSHEQVFILRPAHQSPKSGRILLVAATGTWAAYNDWGGTNHYEGLCGPGRNLPSPVLSLERPLARGFVSLPPGSPRAVLRKAPGPMEAPSYPHMEWALATGHSKKYASAGWASYERHFVAWAEAQGYAVDIVAHTDLHFRPEVLEGYRLAVTVGHDEYWSWEMRDAIDAFVEGGGRVARFAGNFLWQIRLPDEATQVCHKYTARQTDPLMRTGPRNRVTEAWDSPAIGRTGAATFGLNATQGLYAGWSGTSPRGSGGFTVYRPDHWALQDTGLCYGDILGGDSAIFGYEVDGIAHEIRGGLPFPLPGHGAPEGMEILALAPASTIEEGPAIRPGESFLGDEDALYVAGLLTGRTDAAAVEATKRTCGCIVHFRKGGGEVFHAGTCDWVAGLARRDPMVERVTRTVLDRFLGKT